MISKNFAFALLSVFFAFSTSTKAQNQQNEVINTLKGSVWEGIFAVPRLKISGSVRIAFLPQSAPNGDLQYLHKIDSSQWLLKDIAYVDVACPFTPRKLHLNPPQKALAGFISIYPCAQSEAEELNLENNLKRKMIKEIPVTSFRLSPDGKTIQIVATILGFNVVYSLDRKTMGTDIPITKEAMSVWVK